MRCGSRFLPLTLAMVLLRCARQAPARELILPSGRNIKVIAAGKLYLLKLSGIENDKGEVVKPARRCTGT